MSVQSVRQRRVIPKGAQRLLALDGPVAVLSLRVFRVFLASVSFLACLLPAVLFQVLVGWQPTHFAVILGALSTAPLAPALFALLRTGRLLLVNRGEAPAGPVFWNAFVFATRRMWWMAGAVTLAMLIIGYDAALIPDVAVATLATAGLLALVLVAVIAVSSVCDDDPDIADVPLVAVRRAASRLVRRPHIALSWLMLASLAILLLVLPVPGWGAALFVPGVFAVAVQVCNSALGYLGDVKFERIS